MDKIKMLKEANNEIIKLNKYLEEYNFTNEQILIIGKLINDNKYISKKQKDIIENAIKYINDYEYRNYAGDDYHKLKDDGLGKDLLDILEGKENE